MLQILFSKPFQISMKKNTLRSLMLLIGFVSLFTACKDDDHDHDDENEVITTVRLTFTQLEANGTPTTGVAPIVATWKDADGTGAAAPTVNEIALKASKKYKMEIVVLNELANPAEDITPEIRNEGTKHQFFFQKTGTTLGNITYKDADTAGKPIGLTNEVETLATAGTNTLKVILRHEPNKNGANVSTGDITNAGGETDIETTPAFSIKVEL
jgi:hypothetical protein